MQPKTIWKSNPLVVSSVEANLEYHSVVVAFELEGVRTLRETINKSNVVYARVKMEIAQSGEMAYIYDAFQQGKKMRLTLEFEE